MAVQRYKISLNNARFPLVSTWGQRAVLIPALDTAGRSVRSFAGAEENSDYNIPQILYGENFVPVANGVKSASYVALNSATAFVDFDQIFPLRDSAENTVLYSPGGGKNYIYNATTTVWSSTPISAILAATTPAHEMDPVSPKQPATAHVTRAYVDGKTFVCYSRLLAREIAVPANKKDASLYFWDSSVPTLLPVGFNYAAANLVLNLSIPMGQIDGIASSNGYLLVWSGLTVYWAPFNGTSFDFQLYANGEVTGAGSQIPEDIQGPITALIPMSGGYLIFTTKNAIAAFYNANNFASPWIFKGISNAGGVETFEQVATEGGVGAIYAYTTGGMQRLSLNTAEPVFPDVTDFLGGRFIEGFNTGDLTFDEGETSTEFFVKLTYCGQRFVVISYGTFPGIFSYALVYDTALQRWGKLRIVHRDCFSYSYGAQDAELTYNMLADVSYDNIDPMTYDTAIIEGGALTYPRQSVAFLLQDGTIKLAVLDNRTPSDTSEAFVVIGKNQLSRARRVEINHVEVEGLQPGGVVAAWRSDDGRNLGTAETGTLRVQNLDYAEVGFQNVEGKSFTFYVKGNFHLSDIIIEAALGSSF